MYLETIEKYEAQIVNEYLEECREKVRSRVVKHKTQIEEMVEDPRSLNKLTEEYLGKHPDGTLLGLKRFITHNR